jgi:hypothetical protein
MHYSISRILSVLVAATAVATISWAGEIEDTLDWQETLQEQVRHEQRRWLTPFVISTSVGLAPVAALGIDWLANRRCDPERPQCYRDLAVYGEAILAPFTIYPLSLSWSCTVAIEATLDLIHREIGDASSAAALATQWRRRGRNHGVAAAIMGGVALGSLIATFETSDGFWAELIVIFPVLLGASLSLMHIAIAYGYMAHAADGVSSDPEVIARARKPRVQLVHLSPVGVTLAW